MTPSAVSIAQAKIEVGRQGRGRPILFLHPHLGLERSGSFIDALARHGEVFAPSHPGFGASERPAGLSSIDEIAYVYLELLRTLDLRDVLLVGSSLGGWIALAMAIKADDRITKLALLDPIGVKFGPREATDVADMYSIPEAKFVELAYHDGAFARRDVDAMSDQDLVVLARNRESTARFVWSPYMHDPALRRLLYRVHVPTLVLWGAHDRFAPVEYGRRYAEAIAGATFREIAAAGHFPHIEQPAATAEAILAFAGRA